MGSRQPLLRAFPAQPAYHPSKVTPAFLPIYLCSGQSPCPIKLLPTQGPAGKCIQLISACKYICEYLKQSLAHRTVTRRAGIIPTAASSRPPAYPAESWWATWPAPCSWLGGTQHCHLPGSHPRLATEVLAYLSDPEGSFADLVH